MLKNRFRQKSSLFAVLASLACFIAFDTARADRTIRFKPGKSTFTVTNVSSTSLSYSVTCYRPDNTVMKSWASNTVPANGGKQHRIHGPACAPNAGATNITTEGISCLGASGLPYAGAGNLCGATYKLCSIEELSTMKFLETSSNNRYWIANPASFSTSVDGTTWTNQASNAPIFQASTKGYCNDGSSGSGPNSFAMCYSYPVASNSAGAMCCPNPVGYCSLIVTGDTGSLSILDYKSGAPF